MESKERQYAVSPEGEKFPLPLKKDYDTEFKRVEKFSEY